MAGGDAQHHADYLPRKPDAVGYLYARPGTPLVRSQLESRQYSTQVDHLTKDQVASLPVPGLASADMASINAEAMTLLREHKHAIENLATTWPGP